MLLKSGSLPAVTIGLDLQKPFHYVVLKPARGDFSIARCGMAVSYEILNRALLPHYSKKARLIIALPDKDIISRTLQMSKALTENDIALLLEQNTSEYVEDFIEPLALDFRVLSENTEASLQQTVQLIATPKERLEKLLDTLASHQLRPCAVDIESAAIHRAIKKTASIVSMFYAVLLIGNQFVCFMVFDKFSTHFVHTINIGEANFADAIKQSFRLFQAGYSSDRQLACCYLAGSDNALFDKKILVEKIMGMPAILINPFNSFNFLHEEDEPYRQKGAAFLKALGLALWGYK